MLYTAGEMQPMPDLRSWGCVDAGAHHYMRYYHCRRGGWRAAGRCMWSAAFVVGGADV